MYKLLFKQISLLQNTITAGIIMLCLLGFIYEHQSDRIASLKLEQQQLQTKITQIRNFMKQHPQIAKDEQTILKSLNKIDQLLPNELITDKFFAQITAISTNSGSKIVGFSIGDTINTESAAALVVQVNISGDYWQILNFMRQLYQIEQFFTVDSWEVKNINGLLAANLSIKIYAYSPINNFKKQEYTQ